MEADEDRDSDRINECLKLVAAIEREALERELGRSLESDEWDVLGASLSFLVRIIVLYTFHLILFPILFDTYVHSGRSHTARRIEVPLNKKVEQRSGLRPCPHCHLSFYYSRDHWNIVKLKHATALIHDNYSQCELNQFLALGILFRQRLRIAISGLKWVADRIKPVWKP